MKALIILFSLLPLISIQAAQMKYQFPKGFYWGVATSAHQIEGDNKNSDWWQWEQEGNIVNGEISEKATNHWNKVDEDISLMNDLGIGMYRFSIEWAKVEPTPGKFNQKVLDHYKNEIKLLRKNNIEPMLTLHHFTHPVWFTDAGGWLTKDAHKHFLRFVEKVYSELGPLVDYWITFNEPMVLVTAGWLEGHFPPGKNSLDEAIDVAESLIICHAKIYKQLHRLAKNKGHDIKVGLAHHLRVIEPKNPLSIFDQFSAHYSDLLFNRAWLHLLKHGKLNISIPFVLNRKIDVPNAKGTQDFLGLNYYSRDKIKYDSSAAHKIEILIAKNRPVNDMGWEIYPQGIYQTSKMLNDYFKHLPIIITENGLADRRDNKRTDFLKDHLKYVHYAIRRGIPIKGYLHWSLMDNFEWADGRSPKFGLYEVNYDNFERTPRGSAHFYKSVIKNNGF
jgi:beta-glucosidase